MHSNATYNVTKKLLYVCYVNNLQKIYIYIYIKIISISIILYRILSLFIDYLDKLSCKIIIIKYNVFRRFRRLAFFPTYERVRIIS